MHILAVLYTKIQIKYMANFSNPKNMVILSFILRNPIKLNDEFFTCYDNVVYAFRLLDKRGELKDLEKNELGFLLTLELVRLWERDFLNTNIKLFNKIKIIS
jgi:hypothetical protein